MSRAAQPARSLGLPATTVRGGHAVIELPGPGIPVILVPGFTGSKEDFGPLLAPLAAAGHQVVAVDLPGHYQSPGPADPGAYATDALADALAELTAGLGPQVHLVGHSFGGLVCRRLAMADPGQICSLVLLCSGPAALPPPRSSTIEPLIELLEVPGITMSEVWSMVTQSWREQGADEPSDFQRERWLASSLPGLLGTARAVLSEPDLTDKLAGAGVPTLVVTGRDDDAWAPSLQAEMARRLGARHELVAGAHSPAVEAPESLLEVLLPWLAQH